MHLVYHLPCCVTYNGGCAYLHMKLHFCAEQLGIQSHQLSIFVMEVVLEIPSRQE